MIVVAGKAQSALSAATVLFSAGLESAFSKQGTGDDVHWDGKLNLDTTELAGALLDRPEVDVFIDIELQNGLADDSAERMTFRIPAKVLKQAYCGIEAVPVPGTPAYPAPGQVVIKVCGTQTIGSGDSSLEVTGLELAFTPARVLVSVRKPAGGDNLFATIRDESISPDGFTVDLSAPAPAAGYKLDYLLIEEAS